MTTVLTIMLLLLLVAAWFGWRLYAEERAIRREHRHLTTGRYEVGKHVRARRKNVRRRASDERGDT